MAAPPFDTLSNNPLLFDIYNDAVFPAARNSPGPGPPSGLPGGPCGFVDLSPGANGARCGCRRFWSRPPNQARPFPDATTPDQAVWCMCSHHACYHEDVQMPPPPLPSAVAAPPATVAGQENERPRGNREPLSPVQDLVPFHIPPTSGLSMEIPGFTFTGQSFTTNLTERAGPLALTHNLPSPHPPHHPPSNPRSDAASVAAPEASLPDTLSWVNQIQSQHEAASAAGATLPPIPSQCLLPSQSAASTTASSHMRYLKPFAGKGLNTLKGKGVARPNEALPGRDADGPAADAAVPTDDDATVPNSQASPLQVVPLPTAATPRPPSSQDLDARPLFSFANSNSQREALRSLTDTVQGHEQRLQTLENASFSVSGHDDCNDKHDHTDLRVTELESRVEEVEKRLSDDNSTVVSHRRDGGTASIVSGSAHEAGMYAHLQMLQAQVNQLQASSPTYNSPWELEVVILPFALKGVWMLQNEFQSQRPSEAARQASAWDANGDEWTQLPNTHSRQTPDPPSPYLAADWTGQSPGSTWLLPRACAPGRTIDDRLRSRGLIKTISVKGADARSVHLAMNAGFGSVLRTLHTGAPRHSRSRPSPLELAKFERYLGLSQPWVPLRKLHKDSRLRFLSPAEMLTPTLWDAAFLISSVVMKATGMHRLYVTLPGAYIQDQPARECGWTWQRLKDLSRVCPDSQASSSNTIDTSVTEDCWRWSERLDDPPPHTATSPILGGGMGKEQTAAAAADISVAAALNKSRSTAASSSQLFYSAHSPTAIRGKSPAAFTLDRRGSRPPPVRTTSMPMAISATSPPGGSGSGSGSGFNASKARVSSATNASRPSRRSSPFPTTRPSPRIQMATSMAFAGAGAGASMISKRHQRSRSARSPSVRANPGAAAGAFRNTPRWSTTSMSRSPSLMPRGPSAAPEDRGAFGGGSAGAAGAAAARGPSPFCYATPYSTAPMEAHSSSRRRERSASFAAAQHHRGPVRGSRGGYHGENGEEGGEDDEDEDMDRDYSDDDSDDGLYDDHDMMSRGYNDRGDFDDGSDDDDDEEDEEGDSQMNIYEDEPSPHPPHHYHHHHHHAQQAQILQEQQQQSPVQLLPEDEPWPGIEDNMSDGENMDPASYEEEEEDESPGGEALALDIEDLGGGAQGQQHRGAEGGGDDAASDVSSQPSEYPSTQRAWHIIAGPGAVEGGAAGLGMGEGVGVDGGGFRIHVDE